MDVFFCVNRVTLRFSAAQFYKINDGDQALLKAHSLPWAHLPTTKYNAMNHYSLMPYSCTDISGSVYRLQFPIHKGSERDNCVDWRFVCAVGDIKKCVLYALVPKRSLCYYSAK